MNNLVVEYSPDAELVEIRPRPVEWGESICLAADGSSLIEAGEAPKIRLDSTAEGHEIHLGNLLLTGGVWENGHFEIWAPNQESEAEWWLKIHGLPRVAVNYGNLAAMMGDPVAEAVSDIQRATAAHRKGIDHLIFEAQMPRSIDDLTDEQDRYPSIELPAPLARSLDFRRNLLTQASCRGGNSYFLPRDTLFMA